jgi:hypothetical protein
MFCRLMPMLLSYAKQDSHGIFIQGFVTGYDGTGDGERAASTIDDIHQIDDIRHGFVVENSYTNDQPDPGLKRKFVLAKRDGIGKGKHLLNKIGRQEVGEALNIIRSGKINNARGLRKFHLKRDHE